MPPVRASDTVWHQEGNEMRFQLRMSLVAAAITVSCGGTALADMRTYYHVGSWDAFSGPDPDGKQVCGVGSTNPLDNRSFSIRFTVGGNDVLFEVKKPSWNIPSSTQTPVVMQVGLNTPWNVQGGGNGQAIEWTMDRNSMQAFDQQFRGATSMTLSFPNGNEPPWTIALNGSMAISNAFGRCVTELSAREAASRPAAQPPVTQPYGQGPTQPFAPAQAPAAPDQTQPAPATGTQPSR
jgi:hypothetical protein